MAKPSLEQNSVKNILFLNLTAFSKNGGLERFNKCFLKALSELNEEGMINVASYSAYDDKADTQYFPQQHYRGFREQKPKFIINSLLKAQSSDIVILGHINLSILAVLIKIFFPKKKVVLITHGIEVWKELSGNKLNALSKVDGILSVSGFTKNKLVELNKVPAEKITVFPNTIDPYFTIPDSIERKDELRGRYNLDSKDFVLYTLTRLADTEAFKGYDNILKALPEIIKQHPNLKYVLAGKYSENEKARIEKIVGDLGISEHVVLTGFLDESELTAHYQMADLYIMPSKKEGFGIVFIEAAVSGLPVVGGNADGTVDALMQGEIGTLINPDSVDDIINVVDRHILEKVRDNKELIIDRKEKTINNFSFMRYKERLRNIIREY